MPITLPKPKFTVELRKKPYRHYYVEEYDRRLSGVTTIIDGGVPKPWLGPWMKKTALEDCRIQMIKNPYDPKADGYPTWVEAVIEGAAKVPEKIRDEAAEAGTDIHAIIDTLWLGQTVGVSDEYKPAIDAFMDWWKRCGFSPIAGDTPIASLEHGYGGSADALGYKDGAFVLLDWKTSNHISTSYFLQAAAYCQGFRERFGIEINEAWIVRFSKTLPVEFQAERVPCLETAFKAFLGAKTVRDTMKKLEDMRVDA